MSYEKFNHKYKGFGNCSSECIIHIIKIDAKPTKIVLENIGIGTSITNMSEYIAADIINIKDLKPYECEFFETYKEYNYDGIDSISYEWNKKGDTYVAANPNWSPIDDDIKEIILKRIQS